MMMSEVAGDKDEKLRMREKERASDTDGRGRRTDVEVGLRGKFIRYALCLAQ